MTPDILLRPAEPGDHGAYERLFPELGAPGSPMDSAAYASSIMPGTVMAESNGEVVGLVWTRPRGARLHVVHLITAPEFRRRGLGRTLMHAAAARASAAGFRRWMLTVKPENTAARALYVSLGFVETHRSALVLLRWAAVGALPAPSPGVVVQPLATEGLDVPALRLVDGELAAMAAWPGRVMLGAYAGGEVVGVAAFDPGWPGCGTCRVTEVAVARALLEAAAARATSTEGSLHVLAESEALEAALVEAGGTVVMRTVHMEGEVPGDDFPR